MYIESVQLKNFRNYDSLELDLAQGTNIFYGNNAQGKTNILEALYLCGTTKSHKGSRDKDMIQFGKDESHIRMMVKRDELSYRIDMHLKKNKAKGVAINGLPIRKASELFGVVNLVFFSPEDLNIIKNGPGERRRFLDLELCQLDKIYLTDLASYNHIVNQRNKRNSKIVTPRQIAMYLCREIISTPLKSIGKCLGNRDHTTIMHGIDKIEKEINNDENLKNTIETLKKKINPQG